MDLDYICSMNLHPMDRDGGIYIYNYLMMIDAYNHPEDRMWDLSQFPYIHIHINIQHYE